MCTWSLKRPGIDAKTCATPLFIYSQFHHSNLNTAFVWTYFTSLLHHLAKPELTFAHVHTHAQQLPVSPGNMSACSAKTMKTLERILFCPKFSLSGIPFSPAANRFSIQEFKAKSFSINGNILSLWVCHNRFLLSEHIYSQFFLEPPRFGSQIQAITKWCWNLNANSYTNILIYTMMSIQLALAFAKRSLANSG